MNEAANEWRSSRSKKAVPTIATPSAPPSCCAVLKTPHGSMHGTYRMIAEDGRQFEAEIAPFPLTQPGAVN